MTTTNTSGQAASQSPDCGACPGDGTVCANTCRLAEESPGAPAAGIKTWQERMWENCVPSEHEHMQAEIADLRAALLHAHAAIYSGVADPAAPQPSAEPALTAQGVFKGADGLRKLADAQAFWDQQPFGTRLYFGEGIADYLHHDVLRAAIRALAAQPAPAPGLFATCMLVAEAAHRNATGGKAMPSDQVRAIVEEVLAAPAPLNGQQVGEGMVSVCKLDADNYCRIVSLLGMDEEGDPVEEVERLLDNDAKFQAFALGKPAAPLNSVSEQDAKDAALAEAAAVFESAAKHNESKGRTVFAHEQRERANRMRAAMTATPSSQKGTADE